MIWVFGDSFSTNTSKYAWSSIIAAALGEPVRVCSFNGASEYRTLESITAHVDHIRNTDFVIICHTNPHRIYIPDSVGYPTRTLSSHPKCDMVISDTLSRGLLWRLLARVYYKFFFDEHHSYTMHNLIMDSCRRIIGSVTPNLIEVSGFRINNPAVLSFHSVFTAHRGDINHMSPEGNAKVAEILMETIRDRFSQKFV